MRSRNPGLAWSYDLYVLCREQQLFTVDVTKQGGKRTDTKIVTYTTGFHSLPETGGVLDQPHRLMSLFQYFLSGDHVATMKSLS